MRRSTLSGLLVAAALALPALLPLAGPAQAATAGLDPSYGASGIATITGPAGFTADEAVVSRGLTYVAGRAFDSFDGPGGPLRVVALDAAGDPLVSFGGDGAVDVPVASGTSSFVEVSTAAPGGGVVVVVSRRSDATGEDLPTQVVKVLPSGAFDCAYGGDGIAELPAALPGVVAVDVDAAGRAYAAGTRVGQLDPDGNGPRTPVVARLTATGEVDSTFGGDGIVEDPLSAGSTALLDLAAGADGRLVVLTLPTTNGLGASSRDAGELGRLTETGALDTTFGGGDGRVPAATGQDLEVLADGDLLVGKYAFEIEDQAQVARYSANGVLDTTFGVGGTATLPTDSSPDDFVVGMVEDAVGRLLVLRLDCAPCAADLFRLSPTGQLDTTFQLRNGLDGGRYVDVGDVDVLPDGGILVSGTAVQDRPRYIENYGVAKVVDDVATAGSRFTALPPARILDTRSGAKVGTSTIDLQVTGRGGVPTGATAVVMNVTAVAPTGGFITVWPAGEAQPGASSINTRSSSNIPNLVVAKIGAGGKVSLRNSSGTTHLLADVAGYYSVTTGQEFTPVAPVRLLDTRPGAPVGPKQTRSVTVTGALPGGLTVPANASAVVVNVTGVSPSADTFVTVFPRGTARPTTSTLNLKRAVNAPNLVTVKVTNGGISLYNQAGTVDLLVDIAGYCGPGSTDSFVALSPFRQLNTTNATGITSTTKIAGGQTVTLDTAAGGVPLGATAVVLNVIAVAPTTSSFVTVYPAGTTQPRVSNLNNTASVTRANLVVVKVGTSGADAGKVKLFLSSGRSHLIADVAGYFVE